MQPIGRDQFTVTEAPSIHGHHRTVFGSQIFNWQFETYCDLRDQKLADLRGGVLDCDAAVLHRMTAGGVTFVGGKLRIGGDDLQRSKGDIKFFRRDLLKGGLESLTEFDLAGE